MKQKIWIGCDPGKKGAVVAILQDGTLIFNKVPLVGGEIDINGFKNIFLSFLDILPTGEFAQEIQIVVEDVHSIFGSGAKSNFQFGRALGILEGTIASLDLPYIKVQPKKWQKAFFEGVPAVYKPIVKKKNSKGEEVESQPLDTKAMALIAAKRLYPNVSFLASNRCTVPDEGIVDALGMAHYAKHYL